MPQVGDIVISSAGECQVVAVNRRTGDVTYLVSGIKVTCPVRQLRWDEGFGAWVRDNA